MRQNVVFTVTKLSSEHGEYAAETAIQILKGVAPSEIPITANRKWDIFTNGELARKVGIHIPRKITSKAKAVD